MRTIVVREEKRSGKDRWHALFVFGDAKTDALAITLCCAWVTGLAVNALKSFTDELPERFRLAHPRTLRRWC